MYGRPISTSMPNWDVTVCATTAACVDTHGYSVTHREHETMLLGFAIHNEAIQFFCTPQQHCEA